MPVLPPNKEIKLPSFIAKQTDVKAYNNFLERVCCNDSINFAVFSFKTELKDALPYLKHLDPQEEFLFYQEKPDQHKTIAAGGSVKEIVSSGPDRFEAVDNKIEAIKPHISHFNSSSNKDEVFFLGGFSFFDEISSNEWSGFKAASFNLPKRTINIDQNRTSFSVAVHLKANHTPAIIHEQVLNELPIIRSATDTDKIKDKSDVKKVASTEYDTWKSDINYVKDQINNNEYDKIVLARELEVLSSYSFNKHEILNLLRNKYPSCSTYFVRRKDSAAFMGSSPERLLSFDGNNYQTEALAGSMPRGNNRQEDRHLENSLYNSDKNRNEHDLVINHIKNILGDDLKHIKVGEKPSIKKLANVQHLYTPVKFQSTATPLHLLSNLHPTPALAGYPKEIAVDYLEQHCLINRGWYGAPIGWISTKNKGEFTVAIRSGLIYKNKAKLFAGCGIVTDSEPKNEWKESELKFRPMLSALQYDSK